MGALMLFHSKIIKGVVLNKHGVVIDGGIAIESPSVIATVHREALDAGWRRVPSADKDVGMEFEPPPAPDEGKGEN